MSLHNQFPGKPDVQDVHSPMIYIQEETVWQYKHLAVNLRQNPMPDEKLLGEFGNDGWELASMIIHEQMLHIYFKRLKND